MVTAIQTFGELLHFHPHFHVLLTCGAFTPQGAFLERPELDLERLQTAWQEAVFALYLAEEKIEPEVTRRRRASAGPFPIRNATNWRADCSGISRFSTRWDSWPSSRNISRRRGRT